MHEPRHTNEQLLTEATGRVETEMGRLREAAALEKDATICVQT